MTDDAIRGMRRAYSADICVIDDAVGRIVAALDDRGHARRHVDHLHERPRRDGRQPRDDVEVRAVRAGGTCPAHHPPARRLCGRGSSTRSSSTSTFPRRCAPSRSAPDVRASEGRSLLGYLDGDGTRRRGRVDQRELGLRVVRDRAATSSSSTRMRCVAVPAVRPRRRSRRRRQPGRRPGVSRGRRRAHGVVRTSVLRDPARTPAPQPVRPLTPIAARLEGANPRLPPVSSLAGRCLSGVCRHLAKSVETGVAWRRDLRGTRSTRRQFRLPPPASMRR